MPQTFEIEQNPDGVFADDFLSHRVIVESEQLLTPAQPGMVVVRLRLRNRSSPDDPERVRYWTLPVIALRQRMNHYYARHDEDRDEQVYRTHQDLLSAGYRYHSQESEISVLFLVDGIIRDDAVLHRSPVNGEGENFDIETDSSIFEDEEDGSNGNEGEVNKLLKFSVTVDDIIYGTEIDNARTRLLARAEQFARKEEQRIVNRPPPTPSPLEQEIDRRYSIHAEAIRIARVENRFTDTVPEPETRRFFRWLFFGNPLLCQGVSPRLQQVFRRVSTALYLNDRSIQETAQKHNLSQEACSRVRDLLLWSWAQEQAR